MTRFGVIAGNRRRSNVDPNTPAERIVNGSFSSGTAGWTNFYGGRSVSGGKAVFVNNATYDPLLQPITYIAGKYYEVTYTVSSYSAGNIIAQLSGGGTARAGTARSSNGTFVERLQANSGNADFELVSSVSATLNLDDVSMIGPYNTSTVGGA